MVAASDTIKPTYLVSYSSRQASTAQLLRDALGDRSGATWIDVDEIAQDDDWRPGIRAAIDRCDEVVVLVSNASIESAVVREAVESAVRVGKPVRPIVVERLSKPLPDSLARLQFVAVDHPDELGLLQALGLDEA